MVESNYPRRRRVEAPQTPRTRLVEPPASMTRPTRRYGEASRRPPRPAVPPPEPDRSASSRVLLALGFVALLALGAMTVLVVRELLDDGDTGQAAPEPTATTVPDGEQTIGSTTAEGGEPVEGTTIPAAPIPAPTPPFIQATLTGKDLVLSGTVPSSELVEQVGQAAQLVYAPFIQSELIVDEQVPAADWLAAAPPAVMLLQTITEGTLTISDGQITVQGMAASAEDVARLESRLAQATGLPVVASDIQITNLREPIYVIAGSEGQVALSGALPSEEVRMGLAEAAAAIFGPENVLDASTVDNGVSTTLWMYNPEGLMGTLSQFPEFEVRLDGGAFSASLGGGSIFPSDSTEISPEFAQVLNFGIVVLSRDPTMTITIEGHTDSAGPDDYNLALSQSRADAVAAYFIGAGISPERVSAIGVGEAEPASSNDTEEGRSRNRRVEFTLQSND